MRQSRQLAAIMFTDIVGYTALMGKDEERAFALLEKNRQLQKPIVESFHGRWIKEIGDGVIASFSTASDALSAAKQIQEACSANSDLQLRIGIHLGEVVFENNDVFGDGVNIASRIESLGIAGSVLTSKAIRDQLKNKPEFQLESLGQFDFKNVAESMEVFALANPGFAVPKRQEMQGKLKLPQHTPNALKWSIWVALIAAASFAIWFFMEQKKASGESVEQSIAVLAFVDMSQAKDHEYFSDGLSENIIDLLAKVPSLKVIGRTSSFSFKGKNEDLRVIGEKLGAANILEGSVQRDGNRLRVTAQLIRSADGFHLWSEKFDRELKDVFDIQDEVSEAILNAVKVKLLGSEIEVVLKRYTENVEAYQLYLQGRYHHNKYTRDGFIKGIEYFKAAIAVDSTYALAYSGISFCYLTLWYYQWLPADESLPLAVEAARKSIELDGNIAESYLATGRMKLHYEWKVAEAEVDFKKALAINPNSAECHIQLSMCAALLGNNKVALEHAHTAINLDPFSLMTRWMASAALMSADIQASIENGKKLIDLNSEFFFGHWVLGESLLFTGKYAEGLEELELAAQLEKGSMALSSLGGAYGSAGDKSKALEVIKQLESLPGKGNKDIGDVYMSIGEIDRALEYYEKAVKLREPWMLWTGMGVRNLPSFQQDPRIRDFLDRTGIPY